MKTLKTIVSIFIFITLSSVAIAQQNNAVENSVLWKIEHPNLKKASYIFGTLHMMCANDFSIPQKVTRTLNEVEELVLEVNLSDPKEMQALQASMASSKKISEELSKEKFLKLDSLVQKKIGMPLANLDAYGLSNVNFLLLPKMLPCEKIKSLELELMKLATAKEKAINSLETVTAQMDFLNQAYPTDFAYQQLMLFDAYQKDFNDAIQCYKKEDISKAVALISKKQYMDANAVEYMLTQRNKNWVIKMPEIMKNKSVLFAVGAAHLLDQNGVIYLLRQQGYTITPIID